MNISDLRIYASPLTKLRLGKNHDGGYIICDGLEYDCFLSGGIGNDISFEEDFLKKYSNLQCHAFDGSISFIPPPKAFVKITKILHFKFFAGIISRVIRKIYIGETKRVIFQKKYIGKENSKNSTNLHNFFGMYKNIMIKMDIEGAEFAWFDSLNESQVQCIQQMVIEIHSPFDEKKWKLLNRISLSHWLVHLHPNNTSYGEYNTINNIYVPTIFECTYIRKSSIKEITLPFSIDPIPGLLDQKNLQYRSDIIMTGYPYN